MADKKFLLDSDIIIWILRNDKKTLALIEQVKDAGNLSCSAASIIEIQAGAKHGEEEKTNLLLESLTSYSIDRTIANLAGKFLREYRQKGVTLDFVDAIIAATVISYNLTLITYNVKHYPMSKINLYKVSL